VGQFYNNLTDLIYLQKEPYMKELLIESDLSEMMRRIGTSTSITLKVSDLQCLLSTELKNLENTNLVRGLLSTESMIEVMAIQDKKVEIQIAQKFLKHFNETQNFKLIGFGLTRESQDLVIKAERIRNILSEFIEAKNDDSLFID